MWRGVWVWVWVCVCVWVWRGWGEGEGARAYGGHDAGRGGGGGGRYGDEGDSEGGEPGSESEDVEEDEHEDEDEELEIQEEEEDQDQEEGADEGVGVGMSQAGDEYTHVEAGAARAGANALRGRAGICSVSLGARVPVEGAGAPPGAQEIRSASAASGQCIDIAFERLRQRRGAGHPSGAGGSAHEGGGTIDEGDIGSAGVDIGAMCDEGMGCITDLGTSMRCRD
ncbi:hypothetical protein JB92DRAFT_2825639 [Gautieria morchelliformis]|nr:hypothetical protein JB92DRAFT_2825639 [Gautieria morchelliformis]